MKDNKGKFKQKQVTVNTNKGEIYEEMEVCGANRIMEGRRRKWVNGGVRKLGE